MAFFNGDSNNNFFSSFGNNSGMEMDAFYGADGADTLWAWGNDDILDGGAGNDELLGGQGDDRMEGGHGDDNLYDGSGNDWVYGGSGDDHVHADIGDDIYIGDVGVDTISFQILDVLGTNQASTYGVVVDLTKSTLSNGIFGTDQISGFENVTGSEVNDKIFGSAISNFLNGAGGADLLDGRAGNDIMRGGSGGDVIIGGKGGDLIETFAFSLVDGARDRIDYNSVLDSGPTDATRDNILGFDQGGTATDDKIDLSTIDANPFQAGNQSFKFVSGGFGAQVGEVRCVTIGLSTIILIDTDKDKGAEMTIRVEDVAGLKAFDFIL